jgi:hypothetical protein
LDCLGQLCGAMRTLSKTMQASYDKMVGSSPGWAYNGPTTKYDCIPELHIFTQEDHNTINLPTIALIYHDFSVPINLLHYQGKPVTQQVLIRIGVC